MAHQALGAYDMALDYYQRSLKIKERLSNIAGIASSEGQIGLLMMELGQYEQAFSMIVNALNTFIKLKSSDADISVNLLKRLRDKWGPQNFDAAWWQTKGESVPEWVTRDNGPADTETTQPES